MAMQQKTITYYFDETCKNIFLFVLFLAHLSPKFFTTKHLKMLKMVQGSYL